MPNLIDGVVIGSVGGAAVCLAQYLHSKVIQYFESKQIYAWMCKHTASEKGKKFRSTRAIASYNNLTEDRVRYLCSIHKKIYLSTGDKEDMWSIHSRKNSQFFAG